MIKLDTFPYAGEKQLVKVGKKKFILGRKEKLNKNGNPVYHISEIELDGKVGKTHYSELSPPMLVEAFLSKSDKKKSKRNAYSKDKTRK